MKNDLKLNLRSRKNSLLEKKEVLCICLGRRNFHLIGVVNAVHAKEQSKDMCDFHKCPRRPIDKRMSAPLWTSARRNLFLALNCAFPLFEVFHYFFPDK